MNIIKIKKRALVQRAYLIGLLVRRNIKNQYYRSFLGVIWTVLNPLLNMLVMWFVFSQIFGREDVMTLPFPVYLLSGSIIFGVLRSATTSSLTCFVGHSDMLQKTRVAIGIFPMANTISALVSFGFSFIALIMVMVVCSFVPTNGLSYNFQWTILLTVAILPALIIFSLGISFFLSSLYVFFRDLKHIYSVVLTLWMYMTPIFYSINSFEEGSIVVKVIQLNPMYHYVTCFRELLQGVIPNALEWLIMYGFAALSLLLGWLVLAALRNRIVSNL